MVILYRHYGYILIILFCNIKESKNYEDDGMVKQYKNRAWVSEWAAWAGGPTTKRLFFERIMAKTRLYYRQRCYCVDKKNGKQKPQNSRLLSTNGEENRI